MKERFLTGCLTLVLAGLLFAGGYVLGQSRLAPLRLSGSAPGGTPQALEESFRVYWEVFGLVRTEYFDQSINTEALVEGSINGMLATLDDPNTRYLTPEDEATEQLDMSGEFEGIGAEVTDIDGAITIVSAYDGSPAQQAGLRTGDILREADGVVLTGMDISRAARLVRGPAGTPVVLTIERQARQFTVTIVRDRIKIPSVRGEVLPDGVAYLRLSRFRNNAYEEFRAVLADLVAENPRALILDLRNNGGGALTAVLDIADEFIGDGLLMIERFGNGSERNYEARPGGLAVDIPVVVLIDGGSASASEVLAGALRDRIDAPLIGQTSFGKGTVQRIYSLSNGGGARITIARWLTPAGTWVDGQGLVPDFIVTQPEPDENGEIDDRQLQAAIDLLLGRPVRTDPAVPEPATP